MAKAREFGTYVDALHHCRECTAHAFYKPVKQGRHYVVTALRCAGGRITDTEVTLCEDGAWRQVGK